MNLDYRKSEILNYISLGVAKVLKTGYIVDYKYKEQLIKFYIDSMEPLDKIKNEIDTFTDNTIKYLENRELIFDDDINCLNNYIVNINKNILDEPTNQFDNNELYDIKENEFIDNINNSNIELEEEILEDTIDNKATDNILTFKHRINHRLLPVFCVIIPLFIFSIIFFSIDYVNSMGYQKFEVDFDSKMSALYQDKKNQLPKLIITQDEIDKIYPKVKDIKNKSKQKSINRQLKELSDFSKLISSIDSLTTNNILKYDVKQNEIEKLTVAYNKINDKWKILVKDNYKSTINQYKNITDTVSMINNLFTDSSKKTVLKTVLKSDYDNALNKLNSLQQKEIKSEYSKYLDTVLSYINEREKLLEKNRIDSARVVLKVPYISENYNQIYNGCEAASLLMALQYKGYLKNISLYTFSNDMPKTNDPFTGFYRDIFSSEPKNVPHWIAPGPLVKYGRDYSKYNNIYDITGTSLDGLKKEIRNNNPVVIYATYKFNSPTNWIEKMPKNLHVMTLVGYNDVLRKVVINDPWTLSTDKGILNISYDVFEKIYNQIGKMSVVVR